MFGRKSKSGEGSGASGSSQPSQLRRTKSVWEPNPKPPIAPSFYKSSGARQKSLKDMLTGGSIREKMGRLVSKFFIYDNAAPSKASSHHFKNMIIGTQQADNFLKLFCQLNEFLQSIYVDFLLLFGIPK